MKAVAAGTPVGYTQCLGNTSRTMLAILLLCLCALSSPSALSEEVELHSELTEITFKSEWSPWSEVDNKPKDAYRLFSYEFNQWDLSAQNGCRMVTQPVLEIERRAKGKDNTVAGDKAEFVGIGFRKFNISPTGYEHGLEFRFRFSVPGKVVCPSGYTPPNHLDFRFGVQGDGGSETVRETSRPLPFNSLVTESRTVYVDNSPVLDPDKEQHRLVTQGEGFSLVKVCGGANSSVGCAPITIEGPETVTLRYDNNTGYLNYNMKSARPGKYQGVATAVLELR